MAAEGLCEVEASARNLRDAMLHRPKTGKASKVDHISLHLRSRTFFVRPGVWP